MCEESGSDEDAEEPEEICEDDDEASSEEGGDVEEERVSCMVSCSHQPAWRSTTTAARVWERRAGHAGPWWLMVWSRVAQLYSRQCLGARSYFPPPHKGIRRSSRPPVGRPALVEVWRSCAKGWSGAPVLHDKGGDAVGYYRVYCTVRGVP